MPSQKDSQFESVARFVGPTRGPDWKDFQRSDRCLGSWARVEGVPVVESVARLVGPTREPDLMNRLVLRKSLAVGDRFASV